MHYLSVVARDSAADPQSATTTVTILVNDASDESPIFRKEFYSVDIPENAEIGALLLTVEAHDPDTVPDITYRLLEGDNTVFRISPENGRITLAGKLDYEKEEMYKLVVGTREAESGVPQVRLSILFLIYIFTLLRQLV